VTPIFSVRNNMHPFPARRILSMARSLLLLSNSRDADGRFLAHPRDALAAHLEGVRSALFVPWAGVTIAPDAYTARVRPVLAAFGVTVTSLHELANPAEALADAEAIAVGGGNTFRLLERLQYHALLDPLRARIRAGARYVGWSAGSVLAGPTIATTNDMPIVAPAGLGALGVVGFQVNAHFTDAHPPGFRGETRRERLAEYLALNPASRVVGLPEGSWLTVAEAAITLGGPHAAPCFTSSGVVEVAPGDRLDSVLEPDGPPTE
jgi:dipeptidase E